MKYIPTAIGLVLSALTLTACADEYGVGVAYNSAPYGYDGYYDDYYGPIYDGYWGDDGFFYYRNDDHDHHYHRGDGQHFYRGQPNGGNYHSFHATVNPGSGAHMPHFHPGDHH